MRLWSMRSIWTAVVVLVLLAAVCIVTLPITEPDVYWHIRMGADILDNHRLTGDPDWTFGPALATWQTTQSASEVLFALLHASLGYTGLAVFRMLAVVATILSVVACTRAVATGTAIARARALALVSVMTGISMYYTGAMERPQVLSFIAYPVLGVAALRLAYTGTWPSWWVVGLAVMVWSWFHPGVLLVAPVLVLGALGHAAIVRSPRAAAATLVRGIPAVAAALLAPLVGPLGLSYYEHALAISRASRGVITEWGPTGVQMTVFWQMALLVVLWSAAVVAQRRRVGWWPRTALAEAVLVVPVIAAGFAINRYAMPAILLLIAMLARRSAQLLAVRRMRWECWLDRLAVPLMALGLVATVAVLWVRLPVRALPDTAPTRIFQALAEVDGPRRILTTYNASGMTAAMVGDHAAVAIDGRSDRYGYETITTYGRMTRAWPDWQQTFRQYATATDAVLPDGLELLVELQKRGWHEACRDQGTTWLTAPGVTGSCAHVPSGG